MRTAIATIIFLSGFCIVRSQDRYPAKRIDSAETVISKILEHSLLRKAKTGVYVQSLGTGQQVYAKNADELLRTASCLKLLTTAAALTRWGPAHRFKTLIRHDGQIKDGVLKGNFYVQGFGDPYFVTEILFKAVNYLYASGLQRVEGDLVLDAGYLEDTPNAEQNDRAYSAIGGALTFNFNTVVINIRPGLRAGDPALVFTEPKSDYFRIINRSKTLAAGSGISFGQHHVKMIYGENDNTIEVGGGIAVDEQAYSLYKRVSHPKRFYAAVLRETLNIFGIRISGKTRYASLPPGTEILHEIESMDLSYVLSGVNKWSNNFVAGQLLMVMGAEQYGAPGTDRKGLRVLDNFMKNIGVPATSYRLVDGSGLDAGNKMTPRALVKILAHMNDDFRLAPEYISSLSIAGIDGSERRRFSDMKELQGISRLKIGYLWGVSTLSGYMPTRRGDLLAFSILMNDYSREHYTSVQRIQDEICKALFEL